MLQCKVKGITLPPLTLIKRSIYDSTVLQYSRSSTLRYALLWVRPRPDDLLIIWPHSGGQQRVVIELKLKYRSLEETIAQGLEQTWDYMDQTGAEAGHLVIFDRDKKRSWAEKLFVREEDVRNAKIKVWGM